MNKKPILYDIKITTGIAICLVVLGHLASRGETEIMYYVKLKNVIYKFHMPLFLFLSGYIAHYTFKPIKSYSDYFNYLKKKALRLFPAYLILSFTFFLGKAFLKQDEGLLDGVINILFFPANSNSGFLLYIYVLFLYNVSMPLIVYLNNKNFVLFFVISILLSLLVFPSIFSLNFYFWYLPFFILGCFMSKHRTLYLKTIKKGGIIALILFLTWIVLEYLGIVKLPKIVVSFIAIFAFSYVGSVLLKRQRFLEKMGDNSFYIYLFNTMVMGTITVVLVRFLGKQTYYDYFYLLIPVLLVSGVLIPILIHKFVISKIPILKDLIR